MKLHFIIFLVALFNFCFSAPKATSATEKINFSRRQIQSEMSPRGCVVVGRNSKNVQNNIAYFKSSQEKTDSPRSLDSQASSRQNGLTGDRCISSFGCQGRRTCQTTSFGGTRCFLPAPPGFIGLLKCEQSSDCSPGERCYTDRNEDDEDVCLSTSFADEINEEAENANNPQPFIPVDKPCDCIATHLLNHLPRNELVFEQDVMSKVLCDEQNSCATPGHMVTYQGKGMMMKSYCEIVAGCVKKVMPVNSPRYGLKVTVPSFSENMIFTAFSARYETRAEEGMLSLAIRMGV